MSDNSYLYVIIALLPLSATMVVVQVNPYHALVIRGILGAIAALVYAVLGAADVALTEALVGTMLAITLYAVAVRSSMVMRLGVLDGDAIAPHTQPSSETKTDPSFTSLMADMRAFLSQHYMRLELVPYETIQDLEQALIDQDVHAICVRRSPLQSESSSIVDDAQPPYATSVRVQRLYDLMQVELPSSLTSLTLRTGAAPKPTSSPPLGEVQL
jgi:putative multicomponent Na+:H+ antiporter subunit B